MPYPLAVIAILGVIGHALLAARLPLDRSLLPVALLGALVWARPRPRGFGAWPVTLTVAIAALAIAVGSVATLDRSWDGFATWSLTARHLAAGDGLDAPYFRDPAVYHATRGYPLLQPILLQQTMAWLGEHGGRVLFPLLWLAWIHAIASTLRDLQVPRRIAAAATVGAVLVPLFLEPGHGSAESGFADLLLALLLTYGARALLTDRAELAAGVGLLLPLAKNEGVVHLLVLIVVAAMAGRRRAAIAAAILGAAALGLWTPLQQSLAHPGEPPSRGVAALIPALCPLLAAVLGVAASRRSRAAGMLLLAVSPIAALIVATEFDSLVGDTAGLVSLDVHWRALPSILGALGIQMVWVRKLGLTFVVLVVAVIGVLRVRRNPRGRAALAMAWPLVALVAIHAACIVVFVATRPPGLTELFLREGMVRYLVHSVGIVWLAIGILAAPGDQPTLPTEP